MKQQQEFRYIAGEIVRLGDKVRSVAGREGVVTEILIAGTDLANQFHCANGGVLIMEDWSSVKSPVSSVCPAMKTGTMYRSSPGLTPRPSTEVPPVPGEVPEMTI